MVTSFSLGRHGGPAKSTIDTEKANASAIRSYNAAPGTTIAIRQVRSLKGDSVMKSGWSILVLVSIAITLLASEVNALFDYRLEHIFTLSPGTLKMGRIGPVPEGMLNDFSFTGGEVAGPKMRGKLRSEGWGCTPPG